MTKLIWVGFPLVQVTHLKFGLFILHHYLAFDKVVSLFFLFPFPMFAKQKPTFIINKK